jgi:MFS family permease
MTCREDGNSSRLSTPVARNTSRSSVCLALRAVLTNRPMATAQLALAGARGVDLAQLVVVSAYLFANGGAGPVATYVVVRTAAPVLGVPAVTSTGNRRRPGRLLLAMAIVAGVGSITMAVTVASDGPSIGIFISGSAVGVAVGTFRPIVRSMLPTLARSPTELIAANVTTGFVDSASTLLGPLLGVVVAAGLGVPAMLALTATVMAAAGIASSRLPAPPSRKRHDRTGSRAREHTAGLNELARNPEARLVVMLGSTQTAVRGAMTVIVIVFVADVLHAGTSMVGGLHAAIGIGGLLALPATISVVSAIGVHRSVTMGLMLWGIPLALCAATVSPVAAVALFAIIGVGDAVVDVGYYGVLQRAVDQRVLTGALGAVEAMFQAGTAIGVIVGAELLDVFGARGSLVCIGLFLPLLAAATAHRLQSFGCPSRNSCAASRALELSVLPGG